MDWNEIKWRDGKVLKQRLGDAKSPIGLRRGHADPKYLFLSGSRITFPVFICRTPTVATDEELELLRDFIKARYNLD